MLRSLCTQAPRVVGTLFSQRIAAAKLHFIPKPASSVQSMRTPRLPFTSASSRRIHTSNPVRQEDLYKTLGVEKGATDAEIKKNYYKLAKEYHPDVNKDPGAAKKFAAVSSAYEILKDADKRKMYDMHGMDGVNMGQGGPRGRGGEGFEGMSAAEQEEILRRFSQMFRQQGGGGFGGLGDMMGDLFGTGHGGGGMSRMAGDDIQIGLRIGFMEAIRGVKKSVTFDALAACGTCSGSGQKPGSEAKKCTSCKGAGYNMIRQGGYQFQVPCRKCSGSGQSTTPCAVCSGSGVSEKRKTVSVNIPPGVDSSTTLRIPGQGSAGIGGGRAGDLHVRLMVEEDPFFKREGADILVEIPITVSQATLGGEMTIPTIDGEVIMKVPAGTQPDSQQRLPGKGVKTPNRSTPGHQYVKFKVMIPTKLSDNQRRLMEEFSAEDTIKHHDATKHGFFSAALHKIKEFVINKTKT